MIKRQDLSESRIITEMEFEGYLEKDKIIDLITQ
jgi:hypothetical protein